MFHKSNGETVDQPKMVQVSGEDFSTTCLKLRMKLNCIGHLLDITSQIHLVYKSYVGHFEKGKEPILCRTVKQCHHYENVFAKNDESMKKHLSICAAREGITYAFDNG